MERYFVFVKVVLSAIGTFFANLFGGWNAVLTLLVILMLIDLLTGFSYAIINKEVSSQKMRLGIIRKAITLILILVGYHIDLAVIECMKELPSICGITVSFKVFISVYFCFEEFISVVENCANLGIPIPKWLRAILSQASNSINCSTPSEVISLIKRCLSFFDKNKDYSSENDK